MSRVRDVSGCGMAVIGWRCAACLREALQPYVVRPVSISSASSIPTSACPWQGQRDRKKDFARKGPGTTSAVSRVDRPCSSRIRSPNRRSWSLACLRTAPQHHRHHPFTPSRCHFHHNRNDVIAFLFSPPTHRKWYTPLRLWPHSPPPLSLFCPVR